MSPWRRLLIFTALLGAGALATRWMVLPEEDSALGTSVQAIGLLVVAMIAVVPATNRVVSRMLDVVRQPSPRAQAVAALLLWVGGFVYLFGTAHQQHRALFPRLHDECSYALQARMLAEGRLWLPQHELADFFETFHVLTKPVYASIYFPGTALMNVPGVWLSQPSFMMPMALAALVLVLSYLIGSELIDGVGGILVALLVLSTWLFRVHSTMVMSQVPVMLLGLATWWAWLRWRRTYSTGWATAMGACAGWAVITRPVDAVAYALPVMIAVAWELGSRARHRIGRTVACVIAGAVPFLLVQGAFDVGVTGSPFETPYVRYLEENQPGAVFGSQLRRPDRPRTDLPQKHAYHAQCVAVDMERRSEGGLAWLETRLRQTAWAACAFPATLILLPACFWLAAERQRWVILAVAPLFFGLYSLNPLFLRHYALPLAPVAAFAVVLGAKALEGMLSWHVYGRFAAVFFPCALGYLAVTSLPQFEPVAVDEAYAMPVLDRVRKTVATIEPPAVVFFRFSDGGNVHEEPVYNIDASWPDDAAVIRAHDLGRRNGELLRYYASRQPGRSYYVYDRRSGQLFALGDAAAAAEALQVSIAD